MSCHVGWRLQLALITEGGLNSRLREQFERVAVVRSTQFGVGSKVVVVVVNLLRVSRQIDKVPLVNVFPADHRELVNELHDQN